MRRTSSAARPCSPLVQEQWSRDITDTRTREGFLYLAVVIDLFSRCVIGWSMQGRTYIELPLQALRMAVWWRKPKAKVYVHSDHPPSSPATSGKSFIYSTIWPQS